MSQAPMIDAQDFEKLFQHVDTMKRPTHYRLLLILMRDLGLRPIELCKLERSWFRNNELRIVTGRSKRGRARTLPTSAEIREALVAHMGEEQGLLFRNKEGDAFTPGLIGDSIKRLFKRAGIEGSCYSARRSMATRLVEKNVNIITIQNIMGHSDASTTQRYISVSTPMMERALFD